MGEPAVEVAAARSLLTLDVLYPGPDTPHLRLLVRKEWRNTALRASSGIRFVDGSLIVVSAGLGLSERGVTGSANPTENRQINLRCLQGWGGSTVEGWSRGSSAPQSPARERVLKEAWAPTSKRASRGVRPPPEGQDAKSTTPRRRS